MDMTHVKAGDIVICRDSNESRRLGPTRGRVEKVGRKYITVGRRQYDRATGRIHDAYGHAWIETPEEHAAEKELSALERAMRDRGVEFTSGCRLSREVKTRVAKRILSELDGMDGG